MGSFRGNVDPGTIDNRDIASNALIDASKLGFVDRLYGIPLTAAKVWDTLQPLGNTPAADDLGLIPGTFGTDFPVISTGDVKTLTVTRRCLIPVIVPDRYVAAQPFELRVQSGMVTTQAMEAATLTAEAYLADDNGGQQGGNLISAGAQDINSLTISEYVFAVTPANLVAGSQLQIRLTIDVEDSASGTDVIAIISKMAVVCRCRG